MKLKLGVHLLLTLGVVIGCGGETPTRSTLAPDSYFREMEAEFAELILRLDESGDVGEAKGETAFSEFVKAIEEIEPPSSISIEHQGLIEAAQDLTGNGSLDGDILAERFGDACQALQNAAEDLAVNVNLRCDEE